MTDEQALQTAIAASPDDDTVRLAYADFLDEKGGDANAARAEFIRVQCERASGRGDRVRRTVLLKRSMQLIQEFGRAWFVRDWPDAGEQAVTGYTFDRGFVDTVAMVRRGLGDADVARITRSCPLVALVRTWRLSFNQIGDDGLRAIADCPRLGRLTQLGLLCNPFTILGLEVLAASPHLLSLAELSLGYWQAPGPCGLEMLADPNMQHVFASAELIRDVFRRHGKKVRVIA